MWKLTVESDLKNLSLYENFFKYSSAYLFAAVTFCQKLVETPERQIYPNGAVVLYLTFHATELFLKGAILRHFPNEKLNTHTINHMKPRFRKLYPGKKYEIEFPFESEESDVEIPKDTIQEIDTFEYDQMYRYPMSKNGNEWYEHGMLPGFEATSFLKYLKYYEPKLLLIIKEITEIG
jgi:hypothetical protein